MTRFLKVFCVAVAGILLATVTTAIVKEDVDAIEADIKSLADEIAAKYPNKCKISENCEKSVSAVWRNLTQYLTKIDIRVRDLFCGNCTGGLLYGLNKSAISTIISLSGSSNAEAEDVCWTNSIESLLIDAFESHRKDWFSVSFTTVDGVTREFPMYLQSPVDINGLDSLRGLSSPSYQAATTGPKDVVLMFDTSGSMCLQDFMPDARILVERVIKSTLHLGDFAAVLGVSNNVERLGTKEYDDLADPLDPVTSDTKFALRTPVCQHDCGGGTLLEPAFKVATDILLNSDTNGTTSGCDAHIVFITDGYFQQRPIYLAQKFHKYAAYFEEATRRKIHLHTYNFNPYSNMTFQHEFSCRHGGVVVDMSRNTHRNLTSPMLETAWSSFVASQRTAARQGNQGLGAPREITWSDIQYDSTIAQSLISVSMPVYSSLLENRSTATDYLIGVVTARVFAEGLEESLDLNDVPEFAQDLAENMTLVSAYLSYHGMTSFKDRCHKYTGTDSFEQSLRYELFNYTCSEKELVSNSSESESVDLFEISSEVPVDPSGTAVEHCPVVSLRGEDLWENEGLDAFSTSVYRDQRCPSVPANCKTYDVSRAKIRSDAELVYSMQCIDSSSRLQFSIVWVFALSVLILVLSM